MKKALEKIILTVLTALFALALSACEKGQEATEIEVYMADENNAVYTLENDILKFEMDGTTSYFTLTDKRNGMVWNSVPENASEDPLADVAIINDMLSPLIVTYTDEKSNTNTYDGYTYAVKDGTFEITEENGEIVVRYMVGPAIIRYKIPQVIPVERMMIFLEKMDEKAKSAVLKNYQKLDISKISDPEKKKKYLEAIPDLENQPYYALSEYVGGKGLRAFLMQQIEDAFASIDYSEEDYEMDKAPNAAEEKIIIQFNVTIRFSLEGDALKVRVPEEEISYLPEYPLTELRLFPYFMNAGDTDEGYLLLPEAGGAQVFFHNEKAAASSYFSDVYGYDSAISRARRVQETESIMPVYAIAKNGSSLMAVCSLGAGDFAVEADIAGKRSSYDYIRNVFTIVHTMDTDISAKSVSTIRKFQQTHPSDTIELQFIAGTSNSYVDMAKRYRTYLMDTYGSLKKTEDAALPVVLEFVGAIDRTEKILGVPSTRVYTAATYDEAAAAVRSLQNIANLKLRYTDIVNGGNRQTVLASIQEVSGLGGKEGYQNLQDALAEADGDLFLSAYVMEVRKTTLFDGLSNLSDVIKDVTNTDVSIYPYASDTTYQRESASYLFYALNLKKEEKMIANWLAFCEKKQAGASFSDLGDFLVSNFDRNAASSRSDFLYMQSSLLSEAKENGQKLLIQGGYDFAAVYADTIVDLDLFGSEYDITDHQVPFYEIALHGYVSYTGAPINIYGNTKKAVLKAIECGAGFSFRFFECDYKELQNNRYTFTTNLYSANFESWREEIQALSDRVTEEIGDVNNLEIIDHKWLSDTVTLTVYENGTRVYVNHGNEVYSESGITVPAADFVAVKGGGQ